jgi:uncharacterized protein Usg
MILRQKQLVLVNVLYFIPRTHVLQAFYWETEDLPPELFRVHRFLNYWRTNIDAVISEVRVQTRGRDWKAIDHLLNTN